MAVPAGHAAGGVGGRGEYVLHRRRRDHRPPTSTGGEKFRGTWKRQAAHLQEMGARNNKPNGEPALNWDMPGAGAAPPPRPGYGRGDHHAGAAAPRRWRRRRI